MQKLKAFELILRLAIEAKGIDAAMSAVKITDGLTKHLTPEQIQIALEKYEVKEH